MTAAQKLVGSLRFPGVAWSFSRLGYQQRSRTFSHDEIDSNLAGKVCLVTGANSGIGFAIARGLAERHANVWLLCRRRGRANEAHARLATLGAGSVHVETVDMADLGSIRALVERLQVSVVDVLVHNAGALFDHRLVTGDGLERTAALHVVGPECLTRGLLTRLHAADSARVIYISSGGMYTEHLSVADLFDPPEPFDGVRTYALAKRAQVVMAEMWATRESQVAFYAMHPGWVDTIGVKSALPVFYKTTRPWLRSPAEGADTALWLAACRELPVPPGSFVFDRAAVPRHILPGTREDGVERERLWAEIEASLVV
ncbi:MAG: SDR family NAD(P)-dependent oxidoreductase [Proteobacteria bacterium]|nr:SDR family NAD(P)-dependent oxidoreductase [Pseudomonadota bacterium]